MTYDLEFQCKQCGAIACTCSWKEPVIKKTKKCKKKKIKIEEPVKTKDKIYQVPHDLEEK